MRPESDCRKILELASYGFTHTQIADLTRIPRATVRDIVNRFETLAAFEREMAEAKTQAEERKAMRKQEKGKKPKLKKGIWRYSEAQLREAVQQSPSVRQTLDKLGLKAAGGNYETVKRRIAELGIDTSHFRGQGWLKGQRNPHVKMIPLAEILVENSTYSCTSDLRQRLIKEAVFEYRCVSCGLETWLGQPIPLELDHINGSNRDHRLENLRLLCPNCHALTPTYRGRNMDPNGNGH